MELYAFIDRHRHYYIRVGGYSISREPCLQIILNPPRAERRFTADEELRPIVEAFLNAAEQYGGDPIAINLIRENYIMSKILIVNLALMSMHSVVGTQKKADSVVAAGTDLFAITTEEGFNELSYEMRLAIAKTDENVATLHDDEAVERAYEVALAWKPAKAEKPVKAAKAPAPARSKGVKSLIRELFLVQGARHTAAEIVELTGGTLVSVKTALSDLRSPTYCKPGEPLMLERDGDAYALFTDEERAAAAEAKEAAKAAKAAEADAAAEAKAAKANAKAEADAAKAAKANAKAEADAAKE